MKIGVCKLCLQEKELLRRSHIISKFIYDEILIDEETEKRGIKTTVVNGNAINYDKRDTKVTEGNILCADCDGRIIGQYEDYAKPLMYDTTENKFKPSKVINSKTANGHNITIVEGVDSRKFKLFLLSILFRAHYATGATFAQVNINPKQLELLREMLYNGDAGDEKEFPITLFYRPNLPEKAIFQFIKSDLKGYDKYNWVATQLEYVYILSIGEGFPTSLNYNKNQLLIIHQE